MVTVNQAMETDFIDYMMNLDLHFSALGHVTKGELRVDDVSFGFINDVKKVYLTTQKEAESLTKLQAGGISPLALINRGFQVVIDSSAQGHAEIHVSGGQRGLNIRIPVNDFVQLTNACLADIRRGE